MIFALLFSLSLAFAGDNHDHDEHEHEESVHDEKGFELSAEATKSFGVKTEPLRARSFEIPESALVKVKDFKGLYILRAGRYQRIPVKVTARGAASTYKIDMLGFELQPGDQWVKQGTGFIRTSELVQDEGIGHGHSH